MIKCFIDFDVMVDFLIARKPFFQSSAYIFQKAQEGKLLLYTSPLAIANVYYLVRKEWRRQATKDILFKLLGLLNITNLDSKMVTQALLGPMNDFEDALQHESAIPTGCDYIITRNIKDYKASKIKVITPANLITLI